MLVTCWSPKGGCGTTVVAAVLALTRAHDGDEVLLVDLDGDLPAALGCPSEGGPGLGDWLAADEAPLGSLGRLEVPVTRAVSLIPAGDVPTTPDAGRLGLLADLLARDGRTVVVDAGRLPRPVGAIAGSPLAVLAGASDASLLVVRPCYLALQRALAAPLRPTGAVVVDEDGRALDEVDVAAVLGLPVVATVPFEPAVARAVDAGLLARRVPRRARRALGAVR